MMNGSPGLPSIGLPAYQWWSEALHGVASSPGVSFSALNGSEFSYATSFPAPILMGASFDDDLIHQVATIIGVEGRSFANNFKSGFDFWTPNINPFRDPRWGRGLEVPGEDPFHIQQYVYNLITGLQGGLDPEVPTVIATCKHFAVYDVETGRNSDDLNPTAQDLSEYYLAGFKTCTRDAKVGAVMCSYNAEYGIPSCANRYLLQNVLREYWNWSAPYNWITSDCAAVSDIVDNHKYVTSDAAAVAVATNAGTDLGCENSIETNLVDAVAQGLTTEAAIDQALMRLYASLIKVGYFGGAPDNLTSLGWSNVNTPQAQQLAYLAAAEGMTLLKNNGILPLPHSISNVAVIGPWANATTQMQGNYEGTAPFLISPLISFQSAWSNVMFAQGTEINTEDTSGFAAALQTASSADYIIYCGGIDTTIEAEGLDRQTITWPGNQLNLISQLAALDKPLVVVQFGGGQVDDSAILNNTGVGALVWAGYPGQAGGNALHDVLVGSYAIAGRLPISQYPADYINTVNMWDPGMRPDPETGNPGRTYRWYPDAVFPMGYGLHYTNFSFSCSCPVPKSISIASLFQNAKGEYLGTSSWTSLTVSIENTGKLTSDYVALLFLSSGNAGPAPYPIKTLVSYARAKAIAPGSSSKVKLSMTLASLARADAEGNFYIYPGDYTLALDVDSVLTVNFTLTGNATLLEAVPLIPTNPVAMSYLGCFSNPASALSGGPSMSIDLNAPQACSDECGAAGYSYAGVQGSYVDPEHNVDPNFLLILTHCRTCLCASSFSGAPNTTDAACGAACPGDIYEFCGGPGA